MKTQKRHLIILMMFVIGLLQANTIVWAQERATTVDWSGAISAQTITTNTNVYLTGDVTLNGTITVSKGAALNIYAKDANRKITRGSFDGNMFTTEVGDSESEGGILRFNRDPNNTYTITIDGGARFQNNDAKKALLNSPHTGRAIVSRGRLRMHHVIIQNIYHNNHAGAIAFDSQKSKPNGNGYDMAISDLIIRAVKAGTVITFYNQDHHWFNDNDFLRVEIYNCSSMGQEGDHHGGTIRAVGGVKSNLVLNACKIHDNEAAYGGAAAWNAGNGTSCKLKIIGNTKIYNNVAEENGGGISSLSTVELQSAEIYNNRAKKKGGGLCVDTYWGGMDMYSGDGFEVKIVDGVSIHDNTADEAGGGIYMLFQASNDVGFDVNGIPISPQFKFEMTGGSIYNNHAPIGAGVAIDDMAPKRHKNNKSGDLACGKWSLEYVRNVSISGGNIYSNSPVSGSTDTKGAGIYIAKAKAANIADGSIGYTYGDPITGGGEVTAGTLTIKPTGGNIYENLANNGSGGGMYIVDEMNNVSPYYSVCNVNVGAVNIYGNTCSGDGAGMYVQNGIVTVSGAKIGVTSTGASSANTANNNGGGIYMKGGSCLFENGTIAYNEATNGGGVFLDSSSSLTMSGTAGTATITANNALSSGEGGGVYKEGTMTVSGTVVINNNTQASSVTSNVFIPSSASEMYVNIGADGLSCGASIGITKTHSLSHDSNTGQYTQIATGTADNCATACANRFFFDDTNTYGVFNLSSSPYDNKNLYFVETWKNNAASSGISTSTSGTTITVNNAAGLAYIAEQVNSGTNYSGYTINLASNINLDGHYWEPIGESYTACSSTTSHAFSGTFDGKGNTITNLKSVLSVENMGLFGYVGSSGVIKNLIISSSIAAASATSVGSIVGELAGGTVYNCMATGTPTGGTNTGALVGKITSGSVKNSFAISNNAACGSGTAVTNCYVRKASGGTANDMGTATNVGSSGSTTGAFTETVTPYLYKHDDNKVGSTALLTLLNQWVDAQSSPADLASWTRTCASPINGDYPLLKFDGMKCVGTKNGSNDVLTYGSSLNAMLGTHNASGDNIFFWGAESEVTNGSGSAGVYFDEDAVLTHTSTIKAYVGITLDNSAGLGGANPSFGGGATDATDWHFFSSALTAAPIGIDYNNDNTVYKYNENDLLPKYPFTSADGYFPTGVYGDGSYATDYYPDWDLYAYYEPDYHWINFKRNSNSHWHEDLLPTEPEANRPKIYYTNESTFLPGHGYMVALKEEGYLQAYGTLNTGNNITVPVTYTTGVEWTTREGQNLLGNPYQSYLDFDAFADDNNNKTLWPSSTRPFYIIMDEDEADYVTYTKGQTPNEARAGRYLHPHQGFMIKVGSSGTAYFDNTMRSVTMDEGWSSSFRGGDRPNYPLVNLFAKDGNGNRDMVTVELGRPDKGGLLKSHVPGTSTGRLYCRYEEKDYDLAFTEPGLAEAAIRFTTKEDGEYTMTWNTQNGDFSYLHLIDNLTGTDIDCLTTDEYKFSALTSDYESRFRLVFDYTGIEENGEDDASAGSASFAFMMGDQLVVNGEGTLQLFDVTGRLLLTTEVNGVQTTMPKPDTGTGIYLLRLTGVNGSKTQKIVIP